VTAADFWVIPEIRNKVFTLSKICFILCRVVACRVLRKSTIVKVSNVMFSFIDSCCIYKFVQQRQSKVQKNSAHPIQNPIPKTSDISTICTLIVTSSDPHSSTSRA
jgi:hypothetical protein